MARCGMMDFVACVARRGSDGGRSRAERHKVQRMMGCPCLESGARWFRYDSSGARGVVPGRARKRERHPDGLLVSYTAS